VQLVGSRHGIFSCFSTRRLGVVVENLVSAAPELTPNILPRVLRTDEEKTEALENPSVKKALEILHALQKENVSLSDEFLGHIWAMREVDAGFKALTDLLNGRLPYAGPCGGNSLDDIEKAHLPGHFLGVAEYAPGRSAFYATVIAQKIAAQMATLDAVEAADGQITDHTFVKSARAVAKELVECVFVGTRYAGHSDRNALVRLLEKMQSMQLFGRHARAAVGVIASERRAEVDADVYRDFLTALAADGDDADDDDDEEEDDEWSSTAVDDDGDNTLSYEELYAAVQSRLGVFNKIIGTKRVFAAVSHVFGDAYLALGRSLSAMEADFEASIAAATGSMIERGGTNVAPPGCLPKSDPRRSETMPLARGAFRLMMDDAFEEMRRRGNDVDTFEEAYVDVLGWKAKTVFAEDPELLRRLVALVTLVEKDGVRVLAVADAKALVEKAPTYDDMDAGTFARGLCAMAGRKGAETRARQLAEYFSGDASPEVIKAVEIQLNGMGGRTRLEHRNLSNAGGGCPFGGYSTKEAKDMHSASSKLGLEAARKRRAAAPVAATESGSVGVRATRRRGRRFTGAKKDPKSVRGAARFIALGVPLICSDCDAEETSQWSSSKAAPNKPVCRICSNRQVRRASHSLASIVCILRALPVFVTDAYVMLLHSSPPPAATAPAAGSPVRTRAICSSRGSRTAPGSARSAGTKKRPPTASAPRARRAWTRCWLGASRSASRVRRGSARRATASRCAHHGSSHSSHANANARRSRPRFVSCSPRAVCVSRSSQRTEIFTAAGTTCVVCGSCETCTWNNSPDVPGGKVCMKCLDHERLQDKSTSRGSKKRKWKR
jgi:hypothetical protein